jgi:HTH-type transcriptional regulator, transcriptional repressor of NAD biosynthesis genes
MTMSTRATPLRVVLTGSECVGKTVLARELATHYRTVCVPESSRDYATAKGAALDAGDVEPIARAHLTAEDELAPRANHILVLDTDLVSTCVYAEHYYGSCPEWIRQASIDRRGDLYLLLDIDVPWVPDPPARDRGHMRAEMQQLFRDALTARGIQWVDIRGSWDERSAAAIDAIERALSGQNGPTAARAQAMRGDVE